MKFSLVIFLWMYAPYTFALNNIDSIAKKYKPFIWGINMSISLNSDWVKVDKAPSISLMTNTKYRNLIFVGPLFTKKDLLNFNEKGNSGGIQCGYKFFPNTKQKVFDFYFEYDFQSVKYKYEYTTTAGKYFETGIYFQHYIAYGFNLNLIKGLYANNNIGLGFSKLNESWHKEGEDTYTDENTSFSLLIKLGFGYNF